VVIALKASQQVTIRAESYYLNDAGDSKSLSLPAGSSAASPPVCMALDTPSSAWSPATAAIRPRNCAWKRQVDDLHIDPFRRS
jgi:hypothetical protein